MTIDVAFIPSTHTSFDLQRYVYYKKYRFIYNCPLVKVGDIILSADYGQKMIVTEVFPKDERTVHNGITLKTLVIDTMNGKKLSELYPVINPTPEKEMTEKRNLSVSLEEAREWYKSGNATLKKLALTAYTEAELVEGYEAIVAKVERFMTCTCLHHPNTFTHALEALNKLNNLAYVFNGGWKKPIGTEGFFIAPMCSVSSGITVHTIGNWSIMSHSNVTYPGLVYFRYKKDAIKALEIATREGWIDDLK